MYNKHLDAFLMAADCGSFTKAAKKLFITPNALIKQINLLEGRLELTLFRRTNHGIVLTEAGKSIYRDARRIIHISEQALVTAKALTTGKQNIIRLGSSMMNPCRPIMELWVAVSSRYPHIKLSIVPIDDGKSDKTEKVTNRILSLKKREASTSLPDSSRPHYGKIKSMPSKYASFPWRWPSPSIIRWQAAKG